jgi:hypothetical protein
MTEEQLKRLVEIVLKNKELIDSIAAIQGAFIERMLPLFPKEEADSLRRISSHIEQLEALHLASKEAIAAERKFFGLD